LLKHAYHRWEWKQRFATYQHAIVNSRFTQRWLKQLWGLDADVVYPPLRHGLQPSDKQNRILTIAAFSASQHKKHEVTLQAFRQLCDAGLDGWEYVLLGAAGTSAADVEYTDSLRELANGYPISIRTNVGGEELMSTLSSAAILWHSMGYGVDSEQDPGQMEHFGMVATEAMAAGAVPVVFNGGGLPEIVSHGKDGYLWTTPDELKSLTGKLIADPAERDNISASAVRRSRHFGSEQFERRLCNSLAPFVST
jgi:glycosyltransferase involved in cell wall biosynthesis